MPNRQVRRRHIVRDLALSLLVTAGVLTLIEYGARRLNPETGYFLVPTELNCLRRSSLLGMEFRPDCATTWTEGLLTGKQSTSFATNALGLRDAALADDGRFRILSVGDSCTWGWQVGQDGAYPQVMQRLVDERRGPGKYRVINAGVPGYTSYQGLLYLRERGLALRPRIVLIGFGFNDALPNGDVEADLAHQRRTMMLIRLDDYLLTESTFWRWGRTRLRRNPFARPGEQAVAASTEPSAQDRSDGNAAKPFRVPPDKFKRNLTQMIELTRQHGARPVLVSFAGDSMFTDNPYATAMDELGRELEVLVVLYEGPRIDIVHPDAAGYAWLADQILVRLDDGGYLDSDPQRAATDSRP